MYHRGVGVGPAGPAIAGSILAELVKNKNFVRIITNTCSIVSHEAFRT